MSADKTIALESIEHKTSWEELWWSMSKGDILAYNQIKKMDVFEFWPFFDRWRAKQKEDIEKSKRK